MSGKVPINVHAMELARKAILAKYPPRPPLGLPRQLQSQSPSERDVSVLASIHTSPFLGVDARAGMLNMSSIGLRRALAQLEARGWLHLVSFSRRTRGYVRYPNLTPEGLDAAHLEMPREGSGSFLHRRCQLALQSALGRASVEAKIELTLNEKRVDVGYVVEERRVAFEVGMSSVENELSNIHKDFAAGFREVHVLLRESEMLQRIQQHLADERFDPPGLLKLELITDYLPITVTSTEPEDP